MKWLRTLILFDQGDLATTREWRSLHESYVRSILSIDHPKGSGKLALRKKERLPNGQWARNGVGYLKNNFLDHIQSVEGWKAEAQVEIGRDRQQDPIMLYPSLERYQEPITSKSLIQNYRA